MIDYQAMYRFLADAGASCWADALPDQIDKVLSSSRHGDLERWRAVIEQIPTPSTSYKNPAIDRVTIGTVDDIDKRDRVDLERLLRTLHPWRKGPYRLFGIDIECEWRSDWKWQRLKDKITPLSNRLVLDVGCGNGYHCWRMFGDGARAVIGIDPTLLSVMQFQAIRRLYGNAPVYVLPLAIEQVPYGLNAFDTVFSMGVLYHRRSPIDHLLELRDCLRPGGELVLETLVIDGGNGEILVPENRYAKMRNVWFIPSCETLIAWMQRCAYKNIRLIGVTKTGIDEQRSTDWMKFHSLADFLNTENQNLTVEGLPAPKRAIIIANTT